MGLDIRTKKSIRTSLLQSHRRALRATSYIGMFEAEVFRLIDKFTKKGFVNKRIVFREFYRVTRRSKENNYTTRQYLRLVSQLIEGVVSEFQKELLLQK